MASGAGTHDMAQAGGPQRGRAVEYTLQLARGAEGLQATWHTPDGTSAPFPLESPLSVEDAKEHRWYLEESLRFPGPGDQARARAFETRLEGLGQALYKALRPPEDDPLGALMATPGPRLLTISSHEADALALPFELLRDKRGPLVMRGVVLR